MGMIFLIAKDILFGSKFAGYAASRSKTFSIVKDPARLRDVEARLSQSDGMIVIIDLMFHESNPLDFIGRVGKTARVIAYGPHVELELLQKARELGAEAFPRGAIIQLLPQLLG